MGPPSTGVPDRPAIARARTTSSCSRRRPRPSSSSSAACSSPRSCCGTSSRASSAPSRAARRDGADGTTDRSSVPPPVRRDRGRGRRRAHRRVGERSRSRRHRVARGSGHVAEQGDDHRQPRARSGDALHAQRPGGDPVHGRREPQLQGPRGRVAGRDRVVPRRRLGPAGGAHRRVPAQGPQGVRRGPPPDPPVGRSGRPEALHDGARSPTP